MFTKFMVAVVVKNFSSHVEFHAKSIETPVFTSGGCEVHIMTKVEFAVRFPGHKVGDFWEVERK